MYLSQIIFLQILVVSQQIPSAILANLQWISGGILAVTSLEFQQKLYGFIVNSHRNLSRNSGGIPAEINESLCNLGGFPVEF